MATTALEPVGWLLLLTPQLMQLVPDTELESSSSLRIDTTDADAMCAEGGKAVR